VFFKKRMWTGMAQYSEPSKSRKTFVLRCDKPRYDGGVEIDLERYFGRRLQPNQKLMTKAQTQLEQVNRLKAEARRILDQHLKAGCSDQESASTEDEAPEPGTPVTTYRETADSSAKARQQVRGVWQEVCQGTHEVVIGSLGLLVSAAALVGAFGAQCPLLAHVLQPALGYFSQRLTCGYRVFWHLPGQMLGLLPALAVSQS
jgi:hypothetical protein